MRRVLSGLDLANDLRDESAVTRSGGDAYVAAVEGEAPVVWRVTPVGESRRSRSPSRAVRAHGPLHADAVRARSAAGVATRRVVVAR